MAKEAGKKAPTKVATVKAVCKAPLTSYREEIAEMILDDYMEGKSLREASERSNVPYQAVLRWCSHHETFKKRLEGIRQSRAIHFEEEALRVGTSFPDKDAAHGARLAVETYRWGAEVNDPTRYGKKVTHGGDPDKPIQFVINTGFPTPNQYQTPPKLNSDGTILVESEVVSGDTGISTEE